MKRWQKIRAKEERRRRNKLKFVEIYRNLKEYLPQGDNTVEKAMQYSVLSGGKRIRPLIAIEACRICGGSVKDAMPYACAIEFIHTYSLIHDDLPSMDDDDFRRGKPTCHKVFGEANAILAGDALLTLAFNIIVKHAKPKIGVQIIEELTEAIGIDGMVGGQALDMEFKKKSKDKKLLKEINLLKTAKLFEVSTRIGGICAGASREKVKALGKFGLYFGLSFQTVDDELDGESKAGKEAISLIEKAKKELKIFGKKADMLKTIADYVVKRTV